MKAFSATYHRLQKEKLLRHIVFIQESVKDLY